MSDTIRYTLVTPVYNALPYLSECVESILSQTAPNWELILVDDGSTDGSAELCDRYAEIDRRIRAVHQANAGSAAARNRGLDMASGDWIAFFDADDWIERNCLETLSPCLDGGYDLILFAYEEVRGGKRLRPQGCRVRRELDRQDFELLVKDSIDTEKSGDFSPFRAQFWTKLYRTAFLRGHGIYADPELRMNQDVVFNLYVYTYAEKAVFLPEVLYHYRILPNSTCHRYSGEQVKLIRKTLYAIRQYVEVFHPGGEYALMYQKRILASLASACVLDFCHRDNPKPYRERRAEFLRLRDNEPYRSALNAKAIRSFSLQKQVCMWLLRFRLFGLLNFALRTLKYAE